MLVPWHPMRIQDWCMTKDEKKRTEEIKRFTQRKKGRLCILTCKKFHMISYIYEIDLNLVNNLFLN